jgi:DNA-binding transcriptional MerR regulator
MTSGFMIGQAAALAGVTVKTLRHLAAAACVPAWD